MLCLLKNSIAEGDDAIAEEDFDFFTYQGSRVSKSCLNDKLSKVRLTPIYEEI